MALNTEQFEGLLRAALSKFEPPIEQFTFTMPPPGAVPLEERPLTIRGMTITTSDSTVSLPAGEATTTDSVTITGDPVETEVERRPILMVQPLRTPGLEWGETIVPPEWVVLRRRPEPEPPNDLAERLREVLLGQMESLLVLPEAVEMIRECKIGQEAEGEVQLEMRIKGPKVPKALLDKIPPEMFIVLDYEIKRAMIRAFNLTAKDEPRKRTVIVEEDEEP